MQKKSDGIYVKSYGKESNQPIVFIHGFPFDHTLWSEVISKLENEYYCIAYDMRGFGASEVGSGQYTMESFVDDLEHLLDDLGLSNPIVCGFSMGGYIALRANEKFKTKFKALILANTKTKSDNDEAKLKRAAAISSIEQQGTEPFLDNFFSAAFSESFAGTKPQKPIEFKTKIKHFSPLGIKGGLLAMISRTDTTQSLKDTHIPVLLIAGENDEIVPPDMMRDMANTLENSTFVCLNESGHMSMVENYNGFMDAVNGFLKEMKDEEKEI